MDWDEFNHRHLRSLRRPHSDELSSTEVIARAGVTYRQLDYWCRTGVLSPVGNLRGSGSFRRWSIDDIEIVAALGRLAAMGAPTPVLERVAIAVARWLALGDVGAAWLVVPLDGPVSWVAPGRLSDAVADAAWVLCLPIVLTADREGQLAQ